MPRLSILIPALGDSGEFEDTLAAVLQNRPDNCEVIVAHAQRYDDPYRLGPEVCFVPVPGAKQVVELLNAGFEASCSRIIHVVQCGLMVDEGWTDSALECFIDDQVATVAPVIVDAAAPGRILSAGLGYTRWGRVYNISAGRQLEGRPSAKGVIGPTLAAGFYRRSWWRLVRWDESLGDEFAAAHFNLTLARLGATTHQAADCLLRSEDAASVASYEPFGFGAARRAERLFWSHCRSGSGIGTAALRSALMLAEAVLALPSPRSIAGLVGRLVGLANQSSPRAFHAHVHELIQRLAAEQAEAEATATLSLAEARERRPKMAHAKKRAA